MSDPWRARHYRTGYSAEWLPVGQYNWRILKDRHGKAKVFLNAREAREAAKEKFLRSLEPEIRATLPADPDRMAQKLKCEAESWLKSSRLDKKNSTSIRKAGRRHVIVVRGRA